MLLFSPFARDTPRLFPKLDCYWVGSLLSRIFVPKMSPDAPPARRGRADPPLRMGQLRTESLAGGAHGDHGAQGEAPGHHQTQRGAL